MEISEENEDFFEYTKDGNLDDVCINNVSQFRMEFMDSGEIWIRCYRGDKETDVVINLSSSSPITADHHFDEKFQPS